MSSQWVQGKYDSGTEVNGAPIIFFSDFAHVTIRPSHITCGCGWWTRQEVSENADLGVGSTRIFIVWGQTGNVGIVWRKQQQGPALEHGNELVPSHSPVASDHCWTMSSIPASWEYTSQSWQSHLSLREGTRNVHTTVSHAFLRRYSWKCLEVLTKHLMSQCVHRTLLTLKAKGEV